MNPLIPMEGICDPHIHIFNHRAYLYATHDNFVTNGDGFEMTRWEIYSSEDLLHWTHAQTMEPKDFYCGPIDQCWAVDAAERNGRYYWYYSVGSHAVGVGVSDCPAGPFREALGHPLVSVETPPVGVCKWDPCVFVDDDGSAYLIVGTCAGQDEYQIARLGEDMISLAEPLRSIPYYGNPNREDKASIHKVNGIYYLSHSSYYATSDNVYGPYVHRGNTRANIDHGSFFTYHGQTYQATGGMDSPNKYFRSAYLTYCHYRKNGEIVVDPVPMTYGVGQYDASWEKIEAEWFFACKNAKKRERADGGFEMQLRAGGWLAFPNTCHLAKQTQFELSYTNLSEDTRLEVRSGRPDGPLLGTVALGQGSASVSCKLSNEEGHLDLYLVLPQGEAALDWFSLGGDRDRCSGEASRSLILGNGKIVACTGGAADLAVRLTQKGDGVQFALDGGAGGVHTVSLRYSAETPAVLNDLTLPATYGKMKTFTFQMEMERGINHVSFVLEDGAVLLDSVRMEREKTIYRSYPASGGRLYPFGNGCWDGLPQRQWSKEAFSGCKITHLEKTGFRISLDRIDGGTMGGSAKLQISYENVGSESVFCRVEYNDDAALVHFWEEDPTGGLLELPPTGGQFAKAECAVQLRPGDNRITLVLTSPAVPGLAVEAFTILPFDTNCQ